MWKKVFLIFYYYFSFSYNTSIAEGYKTVVKQRLRLRIQLVPVNQTDVPIFVLKSYNRACRLAPQLPRYFSYPLSDGAFFKAKKIKKVKRIPISTSWTGNPHWCKYRMQGTWKFSKYTLQTLDIDNYFNNKW